MAGEIDKGRVQRARRAVEMISSQVRLHPRPFAISVSGAAVFALCTVASSFAVEWVTDRVIVPRFEEGSVGAGTVAAGAALVIGIGLVRAAGVIVRRIWAGKAMWRIADTLGASVVDRLIRQPVAWHQRRPDGDLVGRAGVDTDAAVSVLAPIPFALSTVLLLVVSAVWLIVTDVVLGLVAVAVFPILIGLNTVYQRRVDKHFDEAQAALGRLSASVHESFEGVQLVKAYGAERRETERLAEIAGGVRNARVLAVSLRGTFESLLDVLPSLSNVGLVLLGAHRVNSGEVTIGELSSFVYLFTILVFPLRLIGYVLSELPFSFAGWTRVREVLDEPIEPNPALSMGATPAGTGLRLDEVSFTFPGDTRAALALISFEVPSGRVVAVVGPTGSGKSTLLEVVAGLIAPTTGEVSVAADGGTAMVFQEAFLFAGTIRHNIALGDERLLGDDGAMWSALRAAAADRFVSELPQALDTVVGERGVTVSGGQRQRIALARAVARRPAVLLLDDTTSALDPTTEATVLSNLRDALADTTVLMVASRPSTIALADDVLFLVEGRVVDHGRHGELMARHAGYRALVEAFELDRSEQPVGAAIIGGGS